MRALLTFLALLTLTLFGCATTPAGCVCVPTAPAWVQPADTRTYSTQEVLAECQRLAPLAVVETSDATFIALSHAWLEAAAVWSWEYGKARGIRFTAESWDCDKFAAGFALAANLSASEAGVRAQPLLARIHVHQINAFGGVAAGGGHALNAFLSERGIFVFEPQSRALVPLASYPNRSSIFRIKIGG